MRIIAGKHKSRNFKAPSGNHTHPMSEKARGAIFNMLGDIEGMTVIDAYAGSGSLAFEAISRGAKSAVLIDNNKKANTTLIDNVESLRFDEIATVIQSNSVTYITNEGLTADIVFVDPPYTDFRPEHIPIMAAAVEPNGVLVISHPAWYHSKLNKKTWKLESTRAYANAHISIYKKVK